MPRSPRLPFLLAVCSLTPLLRHVPSLSFILLTHATPAHIAAFAHCCKHFRLFTRIPIYATAPVISLGRTLLQDIYSSTPLAAGIIPQSSLSDTSLSYGTSVSEADSPRILLQPPTSEEIASYFALIHPLKYSQPHQPLPSPFSPPLNDLTITAFNAGHTLGGTIWRIQHGMESIVYAVDWNQARENVLAGAAWLGGSGSGGAEVIEELRKPTALICSARGAEKNVVAGKRDDQLLDHILTALAKDGTVLIPTDTSARVLELAYVLEHAWRKAWRRDAPDKSSSSILKRAKLYLASRNVGATMRYARSMLEWMDENVVRELENEVTTAVSSQNRRNQHSKQVSHQEAGNQNGRGSNTPFDFRYVKLIEQRKRIEKLLARKGPRVILASDSSLEWGFSKDILRSIAADSTNLVILTDGFVKNTETTQGQHSLSATLSRWLHEKRDGVAMESGQDGQIIDQVHTNARDLSIKEIRCVPLEGKELLIYQQHLASQRQSGNLSQLGDPGSLETSADAVDEASSSSSSSSEESDPERQGKALNTSAKTAKFNRNKTQLGKEALGVNALLRQPGVYDFDVRGKKGREQIFPFVSKRRRADDFGDVIRPEDYLRAEERDEVDAQDMRNADPRKQTGFGEKRKWRDSQRQDDSKPLNGSPNKRRQVMNTSGKQVTANSTNGVAINEHGVTNADAEDSLGESEDEPEASTDGPSKVVTEVSFIKANIRIAHVDFAGLHDKRSLSNLIPLIQPKKLILVSGNPSETKDLAEGFRKKLNTQAVGSDGQKSDFVFVPSNGEFVDASIDTNAWIVKLSETIVRRLHWQNVRGLGVVTLMGYLAASTADNASSDPITRKKLKMVKSDADEPTADEISDASENTAATMPTLDVLPPSMVAATRSVAQSLHVGDLRLADLRKILQSQGHTAEFRGAGTLMIDSLVAIRKSGTGKIEVEGGGFNLPEPRPKALEDSFYSVKRSIYDGLAIIAGG